MPTQAPKNTKPWTPKEDSVLITKYNRTPWPEVQDLLPNRTRTQCIQRASRPRTRHGANIPKKFGTESRWAAKENTVLINRYATDTVDKLLEALPGHTWQQCMNRARHLRECGTLVPFRLELGPRWSPTEEDILRKYYTVVSKEELLEMLPGRTWDQCIQHASNLRKRRHDNTMPKRFDFEPWTESEDKILLENWNKIPTRELLKRLPNHNLRSCYQRLSRLKAIHNLKIPDKQPELWFIPPRASRAHTDGKSGIPGVWYKAEQNAYRVDVMVLGNKIILGQYRTPEKAAAMRKHTEDLIDKWADEGVLTPEFAAKLTKESFGKHLSTANTSGYTGVCWKEKECCYIAKIGLCKHGAKIHLQLGRYQNPEQASQVFQVAKATYTGIADRENTSLQEMKDIVMRAVEPYR